MTNPILGCGVIWGGWSYPEEAILVGRGAALGFRKSLGGHRDKGTSVGVTFGFPPFILPHWSLFPFVYFDLEEQEQGAKHTCVSLSLFCPGCVHHLWSPSLMTPGSPFLPPCPSIGLKGRRRGGGPSPRAVHLQPRWRPHPDIFLGGKCFALSLT